MDRLEFQKLVHSMKDAYASIYEDKATDKADEDFRRRQEGRKVAKDAAEANAKRKEEGSAAERMDAAASKKEEEEKKKADRRAKLLAKRDGGRNPKAARGGPALNADDYIALDGNKAAQKRMMKRAKIRDAKEEGKNNS